MTFLRSGEKWGQIDNSDKHNVEKGKPFIVTGGETDELIKKNHGQRYGMEVIFYDKDGKRINKQYTDHPEMYQFFFTVASYKNNRTEEQIETNGNSDPLMAYRFRDTDPEHLRVKESIPDSGEETKIAKIPMGFKGYFAIKKGNISYNLKVSLYKWAEGKKTGEDAFNKLPKGSHVKEELAFSLPINVVAIYGSTDTEYEQYIKDLANYFGITEEKMKELLRGDEDIDESSNFWM